MSEILTVENARKKNPTTELRILISEDSNGTLDVKWQARIKGTEVSVPMRPSHVLGQLYAAGTIIANQQYIGISSSDKSNSSSEGKRRGKGKD